MEKDIFKKLHIGEFFHDTRIKVEWEVLEREVYGLKCYCTKGEEDSSKHEKDKWNLGDVEFWGFDSAKYFTLGKHPDNIKNGPPQPQQMTVAEALKRGLEIGDDVTVVIKGKVTIIGNDTSIFVKYHNGTAGCWFFSRTNVIIEPEPPYTPKDREFCTVVTKNGFATECEAYECKGRMYAIPLKDGLPDGIFAPEQIEKFLKL